MAVAASARSIAMTEQQRRDFEEKGFILIEEFFTPEELNLSNTVRKVFYTGYHYRWLRPTDYVEQDPELIARSSPIRRQLLGALATGSNPLGRNPDTEPSSQYWLTRNWDDVPLKAWAEARLEGPQQLETVHI
jgi:hypothetical protein